jgi:hypothetical protein
MLRELFSPLDGLRFTSRLIAGEQPSAELVTVLVSRYVDGKTSVNEEAHPLTSLKGERDDTLYLVLSGTETTEEYDVYPFVTIASHRLYYYSRTRAGEVVGFEFSAPFRVQTKFERTSRKFLIFGPPVYGGYEAAITFLDARTTYDQRWRSSSKHPEAATIDRAQEDAQ